MSLLIGLVASTLLYYKNKKNTEVPKNVIYFLFVLRFFSITLITLFLLSIFLKQVKNETQHPIILFAIDNSSSMVMQKDSLEVKKDLLTKLENLKNSISKNFEVKSILFGDKTISSPKNPNFNVKE